MSSWKRPFAPEGSGTGGPGEHNHDERYPAGDPSAPTDGYVWTYDVASGGWLPKAVPSAPVASVDSRTGAVDLSDRYLGISAKAADSDLLDGIDSSGFAPASHVGSGGSAHAAATQSAAGFQSAADKAKLDAFLAADKYAREISPFFNLMPDSGRLAGKINPLQLYITNNNQPTGALLPFANSGFLSPYNSTTVSDVGGRYIFDNSTHGGARDALTQDVADLLVAMGRSGAAARYGVEFWIATYTMGSGVLAPRIYADGVTRYTMTVNNLRALFGFGNTATAVFWVRLKTEGTADNRVGVRNNAQVLRANQPVSGDLILGVADGWTHVNAQMITTIGYNTNFPGLDARQGDVVQIAIPAFFPGAARPGVHTAPVATINELLA